MPRKISAKTPVGHTEQGNHRHEKRTQSHLCHQFAPYIQSQVLTPPRSYEFTIIRRFISGRSSSTALVRSADSNYRRFATHSQHISLHRRSVAARSDILMHNACARAGEGSFVVSQFYLPGKSRIFENDHLHLAFLNRFILWNRSNTVSAISCRGIPGVEIHNLVDRHRSAEYNYLWE